MEIKLYTFPKDRNSTKIPTASTASVTLQNVQLKDECSITSPRIVIQRLDLNAAPTNYTYCYIDKFHRYYFINDWTWVNFAWEVSMTVDVLGSFKSQIGALQCYIERAASSYNGDIIDTFYPAKSDIAITHVSVANAWYGVAPSGGSYVIGVINESGTRVGAVSYYACSQTQLTNVLDFLFSSNIFDSSSITEMGVGLYKSFFNPFQYIVSCLWFPFSADTFGDTTGNIRVGYWDTGIAATIVKSLAHKTYVTATIPNHPQKSRGNYLNHAPYTKITLYAPPFGTIPIDGTYLEIGNYLYCPVYIDHITGTATIRVNITASSSSLNETKYITEREAVIAVPIQLAQVYNEYSRDPLTALATVAAQGLAHIVGTTIGSSIEMQTPTVSSNGNNGAFTTFIMPPGITVEHYKLVNEDLARFGRPLMDKRTINTLSGYIKCIHPHAEISCTLDEKNQIEALLTDGFYYE